MNSLRTYCGVAFAGQTWRQIAYLLAGLPVSIVLFTYVVLGYVLGVSLAIIIVGLVLLIGLQASLRPLGEFERAFANRLLGADIAPPEKRLLPDGADSGRVQRALSLFTDAHAWRVLAWIVTRIVLGVVGFVVAVIAVVVPIALLAAPFIAASHKLGWGSLIDYDHSDPNATHVVDYVTSLVLITTPVIFAIAPAFFWLSRGVAALHVAFARWALGPDTRNIAKFATERAERAEEQVRIDQELHDSIGHMITMNIVQAGAGVHVFDADPEFARQALKNIEERGRAAMGELDRIIAAMRGDREPERAPLPDFGDIAAIVETSRRAGVAVEADIEPISVPDAIGRAAFGIVREALTNAARHADGAEVRVRVARDGDALGIEVVNGAAVKGNSAESTSVAAARGGGRRGLAGIRDRVALLGGHSAAGPEASGFAVRALLPLSTELANEGDPESPWAALREKVTT